jgi:hypothetical protein
MWRFFFSRPENVDPTIMTEPNRLQYEACRRAITRFSREEREIISMYFSSAWGKDMRAVDDYSKSTGVAVNRIWDVVKAANRTACEERGLIDVKGD